MGNPKFTLRLAPLFDYSNILSFLQSITPLLHYSNTPMFYSM
jgi:hypothetical protein